MSEAPRTRSDRMNVNAQDSSRPGFIGWLESRLRRLRGPAMVGIMGLLYLLVALTLGAALAPSVALVPYLFKQSEAFPTVLRLLCQGTSLVLGLLTFALGAIVVVPLVNRLFLPWVGPFRGPYYSLAALGWYIHNFLLYSVRYSILEWITPGPFNLFFFRRMGMRIGNRVEINTAHISDPALITLEDGVTIGGSATLLAHYAAEGFLVISPLVIRKNATIGLRAIVFGGVEIGERAKVLPNSVVLPKTVIPAGEVWGGVPAVKIGGGRS